MSNAIYDARTFFVSDGGQDSTTKSQSDRTSQGCPLPPFLFVIIMNVIITDARAALRDSVGDSEVTDCYTQTIIVDEHGELAQIYMDIIANQGND